MGLCLEQQYGVALRHQRDGGAALPGPARVLEREVRLEGGVPPLTAAPSPLVLPPGVRQGHVDLEGQAAAALGTAAHGPQGPVQRTVHVDHSLDVRLTRCGVRLAVLKRKGKARWVMGTLVGKSSWYSWGQ